MKYLTAAAILGTTMALTACGGGDSSSSGSNTTTTTTTSPTTSTGTPPTTPTTTPTTPTTPTTTPACEVSGSNIYGKAGTSCTFSLPNFNGGATQTLVCNANGGGSVAGSFNFGNSFNINGTTLSCK